MDKDYFLEHLYGLSPEEAKNKLVKMVEEARNKKEAENEKKREEALEKAKERGYTVNMHSGDKTWYALSHELYRHVLQLYPLTDEFEFKFMKGILVLSTGKCGSFMNDEHFRKIEREMRAGVFDLL